MQETAVKIINLIMVGIAIAAVLVAAVGLAVLVYVAYVY